MALSETENTSHMLCVVTLTLNRPEMLRRAILSVKANHTSCRIRHIIGSEQAQALSQHPLLNDISQQVHWIQLPEITTEEYASSRIAKLRTLMLAYVKEPWVAFLDDDNEVDSHHYADLLSYARQNHLAAVHSWRRLIEKDGSAFDGMRYPWHPSPQRAKELWKWCLANGIIVQGDNIVRDAYVCDPDANNVATIDMNEWVFQTTTLHQIGFETTYTREEEKNQVGEDDKLLSRLIKANIEFGCTKKATVLYRLGGVSNQ